MRILAGVVRSIANVKLQAMGTVSGTFRHYPDACLIWIDAHAVRLALRNR